MARPPEACRPTRIYTVTEVYPEHVVLDGNHPLAGIALRLDVKVRDVREATEAEIEAGSVSDSRHQRDEHRTGQLTAALSFALQCLPVEPKPPAPRSDAPNSSTTRNCACTTGTMTSCAMRSIGCTVKLVCPRFQQLTISWPW